MDRVRSNPPHSLSLLKGFSNSPLSEERNSPSMWGLAAIIALFTWPGNEFDTEGGVLWYQTRIEGIPVSYAIVAGLLLLAVLFSSRKGVNVGARLSDFRIWNWALVGWVTLIVALVAAVLRQSNEPFVDWRNWAVLAVTVPVMVAFLEGRQGVRFLLPNLSILYGGFALIHLGNWLAGGGTGLFGVRIPLFDTYDLSLAVFGASVTVACLTFRAPSVAPSYRTLLLIAAVANALLVLLSFRRSIWAYLVAAVVALFVFGLRSKRISMGSGLGLAAGAIAVATVAVFAIGSDAIGERLSSFNPFEDNEFSATNADHVNDIGDALGVVAENPILGLGIGESYETQLIANWKPESFEVHNAFLNAWLKFGILGLVGFIGFHFALIRGLVRAGKNRLPDLLAAGCVVGAEQIVNLVQTWIYNSIQATLLRGVVIAVLVTVGWRAVHAENRELAQVA